MAAAMKRAMRPRSRSLLRPRKGEALAKSAGRMLVVATWASTDFDPSTEWEGRMRFLAAGASLMILAAGYRLAVAYRRYLHFDHPAATVLASQLVVVGVIVAALGEITNELYWLFF